MHASPHPAPAHLRTRKISIKMISSYRVLVIWRWKIVRRAPLSGVWWCFNLKAARPRRATRQFVHGIHATHWLRLINGAVWYFLKICSTAGQSPSVHARSNSGDTNVSHRHHHHPLCPAAKPLQYRTRHKRRRLPQSIRLYACAVVLLDVHVYNAYGSCVLCMHCCGDRCKHNSLRK